MRTTMSWPAGQIFPTFSQQEPMLDAFDVSCAGRDELAALSSLQGIVNKRAVRLLLLDPSSDEGAGTWPETLGLTYRMCNLVFLFKKYLPEASGVVLYREEFSRHYVNLACTAASTKNAVPMTPALANRLREAGVRVPILENLTDLSMTDPKEIYAYAYETYWSKNTHRLLISQNPRDAYHLRDLAAAAGCAVVFLENRDPEARAIYDRFLADMEPGKAIVMGWYTEERSGITAATAHGLSTVPADLYLNYTVYARKTPVRLPAVPPAAPALENKVYCALFVSDGDNIQYCQRFMRKHWDALAKERGRLPLTWTISPALAEAAPDLLNYYYATATPADCFASGPSGLGYAMPVNTLDEEIPAGNYVKDNEAFAAYVKLSARYFEKAGLSVATVWDDLTPEQRSVYAKNAAGLKGLTVQRFTEDQESVSSWEGRFPIKQFTPCYCTKADHLERVLTREVTAWQKEAPRFIACQLSVWGEVTVEELVAIGEKMQVLSGGRFAFVRGDDFFDLMRQEKNR